MVTVERRRSRWKRLVRPQAGRDAGMTLADLLVSMAVTAVVMALVTTAIVQMYRSSTRSEVLSDETAQLQFAFQRLDRSMRYATAISEPNAAPISGNWYVEWSSLGDGVTTCHQLRLSGSTGQLQQRSSRAGGPAGGWGTVASFLFGDRPFSLQAASSSALPHHQLTVDVTVRLPGEVQSERRSVFSFTALNTSWATDSRGVCTDLGRP